MLISDTAFCSLSFLYFLICFHCGVFCAYFSCLFLFFPFLLLSSHIIPFLFGIDCSYFFLSFSLHFLLFHCGVFCAYFCFLFFSSPCYCSSHIIPSHIGVGCCYFFLSPSYTFTFASIVVFYAFTSPFFSSLSSCYFFSSRLIPFR